MEIYIVATMCFKNTSYHIFILTVQLCKPMITIVSPDASAPITPPVSSANTPEITPERETCKQ